MSFKMWIESEQQELEVLNTKDLTSNNQHSFGNAAIVLDDGTLEGYHVTDDPKKIMDAFSGTKKLTATYRKGIGKYAELGPGLYVSANTNFWVNRSSGKWDFLKKLTPEQKQALADALSSHNSLKDQLIDGRVFRYVTKNEQDTAHRYIDQWLKIGHDPTIIQLAGQPYNIAFWKPEFLEPLGIEPAAPPKIIRVVFSGRFVNLNRHVGDWSVVSGCIRKGYDGGFNPGGISANPELCIWRKESIRNLELLPARKW